MTDSMIGRTLGRYQVDGKLGQGGMGMVYKATQASLNRTVAIKVLPAQLAMDREFVERFRQEAQVIASLQHESIVHVYDIDQQRLPSGESLYFIVMEFVDGETLRAAVARHQRLPPDQVRAIGIAVTQALEYAHGRGIIHRDIKSANVMITRGGKVKLMDFGIAKAAGGVKTMTGSVLGTPDYMAPEQARSGKVSAQSDLYSLGVMLFEIATGQMPFTASDPFAVAIKHLTEKAPSARQLVPAIPAWLDAVILRLMAKEADERYASARDLLDDLRRETATPVVSATSQEAIPTVATPKAGMAPLVPGPSTPPAWPAQPPTPGPAWGTPAGSGPGWGAEWGQGSTPSPWGATPPPVPQVATPVPPGPTPPGAWGPSTPAPAGGWGATPPPHLWPANPSPQTPSSGSPQTPSAMPSPPMPFLPPAAPTAATAFDVPRASRGHKLLWIALFLLALVVGLGGGAWFTRRDRVELKPAPGSPAEGKISDRGAPASAPSGPTPQPSQLVDPATDDSPRQAPAASQDERSPAPRLPAAERQIQDSIDPRSPEPDRQDAPVVPTPTQQESAPAYPAVPSAELWREIVRLKEMENYHSLREALDRLLAQNPAHTEAQAWRRKADGWVASRDKDLEEELEDQLDCLVEAVSENELADAAECWGGSLDAQTQAYLVNLWRNYRKPKLEYRILSRRPWDHDIDFEVQLTVRSRDRGQVQKTWRGRVAADSAGVRFATPLG